MPDNTGPLPNFTRWPSFPFEGDMRVKPLADPVEVEPPRSGEGGNDCVACGTPDDAYIWVSERWRVRAMDRPTGLPMVLILECRSHLDLGDLPNLLAAELGVMTVRLERAVRSLDGVARVHVNRWGDGSAHLHLWFLARPYGRLQLRGTFLSLWDDILPAIPEHQWRENLALVAAWLAEFGGQAIAEPPHIEWQSPSTFSSDTSTDAEPGRAAADTSQAPPSGSYAGPAAEEKQADASTGISSGGAADGIHTGSSTAEANAGATGAGVGGGTAAGAGAGHGVAGYAAGGGASTGDRSGVGAADGSASANTTGVEGGGGVGGVAPGGVVGGGGGVGGVAPGGVVGGGGGVGGAVAGGVVGDGAVASGAARGGAVGRIMGAGGADVGHDGGSGAREGDGGGQRNVLGVGSGDAEARDVTGSEQGGLRAVQDGHVDDPAQADGSPGGRQIPGPRRETQPTT